MTPRDKFVEAMRRMVARQPLAMVREDLRAMAVAFADQHCMPISNEDGSYHGCYAVDTGEDNPMYNHQQCRAAILRDCGLEEK